MQQSKHTRSRLMPRYPFVSTQCGCQCRLPGLWVCAHTSIGASYCSVSRFRRTTFRGKESGLHSDHTSDASRTSIIMVRFDCSRERRANHERDRTTTS